MIRAAVILATGFTVREGDNSGLRAIEDELRRTLDENEVYITRRAWNEQWNQVARDVVARTPQRIVWIGHSYGAGVGLPRFARNIGYFDGPRIGLAALIDPVPRWWANMGAAAAGFLLGRAVGTIKLPPNVDRCIYWRQTAGAPYGRPVDDGGNARAIGTVYAARSELARRRSWETVTLQTSPPSHSEIDGYAPVRHAIVEAVLGFAK